MGYSCVRWFFIPLCSVRGVVLLDTYLVLLCCAHFRYWLLLARVLFLPFWDGGGGHVRCPSVVGALQYAMRFAFVLRSRLLAYAGEKRTGSYVYVLFSSGRFIQF